MWVAEFSPNTPLSIQTTDTRLLLHAKDAEMSGYDRVVLKARDTDLLILALSHHTKLSRELWLSAGTSKHPKFIPVHAISQTDHVITCWHTMLSPVVIQLASLQGKARNLHGTHFLRNQNCLARSGYLLNVQMRHCERQNSLCVT